MPEETYPPSEPYYYQELSNPRPELSPKPIDKRPVIYGIIAAVVIILIFGGIGVGLYLNPPIAAVLRDIFIIFLGLGAFVIILLLIVLVVITAYLVLKVNDLVRLLDREIKPLLAQVQETTRTVKGTTSFISDQAVKPVIATASTIAATQAIFKSLFQRR
jgi:TM2 domain-containing membrane protein YozV